MKEDGFTPGRDCWLNILHEVHDVEYAWDVVENHMNMKLDHRTVAALLGVCRRATALDPNERLGQARAVWRRMEDDDIFPNGQAYIEMMEMCRERSMTKEILRLFEEAFMKNVKIKTQRPYVLAIEAF